MEGNSSSEQSIGSFVVSGTTVASISSIPDLPKARPKSWQHFEDLEIIKIKSGYAEYYVMNEDEDKIYTAVLTYDERSCWYGWLCCFQPDFGYIPHNSLYPDPPEVNYKRHPLNISGFGVQVYDNDAEDCMRFHRPPHDVKNLNVDESMKISGPCGGLMGTIVVPRNKGGDVYDIIDPSGEVVFEVPARVTDEDKQHVYDVMKIHKSGDKTPGARITIEGKGKHDLHVSLTNFQRIPAGDFHVQFDLSLTPREKAMLLAAAFFIRIREFSAYIPMVEANIAAKAIVQ